MAVKITVISSDLAFKLYLEKELTAKQLKIGRETNSIFELTRYINTALTNILILDIESPSLGVTPASVKALLDGSGMYVILLGMKGSAQYLVNGVQGSISKPDMANDFSKRIFLRNLIERIDVILRKGVRQVVSNLNEIADIDEKVIAIAASTGGTEALSVVLSSMPKETPPILIVQHMPSVFTYQFAMRLNKQCQIGVKEAALNDFAKHNQALIAPGDYHMRAKNKNGKLHLECFKGDKVNAVRPAADVLFDSMSAFMGPNVVGCILTGMGSDGAHGLLRLKRKGAKVIAQNEETCVVYGMPKAAVDIGAADFVLPLDKIASKLLELAK